MKHIHYNNQTLGLLRRLLALLINKELPLIILAPPSITTILQQSGTPFCHNNLNLAISKSYRMSISELPCLSPSTQGPLYLDFPSGLVNQPSYPSVCIIPFFTAPTYLAPSLNMTVAFLSVSIPGRVSAAKLALPRYSETSPFSNLIAMFYEFQVRLNNSQSFLLNTSPLHSKSFSHLPRITNLTSYYRLGYVRVQIRYICPPSPFAESSFKGPMQYPPRNTITP